MEWNQMNINERMIEVARSIGSRVSTEGGVIIENNSGGILGELPGIISRCEGDEVNCYPGVPGATCHRVAYYIYLECILKSKARWPFNLEQMFHEIILHCQPTRCGNITRDIRIITDAWSPWVLEKWRDALVTLTRQGVKFSTLLVAPGGKVSLLDLF